MSLPHISNVAVALIHINFPLIGEKRTIREVMCLRSGLCLGSLTIPLHPSVSAICEYECVCERTTPTHAVRRTAESRSAPCPVLLCCTLGLEGKRRSDPSTLL